MLATVKQQVYIGNVHVCMLLVYVVCVCVCPSEHKNLLKFCMEGQSVCIYYVCGMDTHYTQIKLNVVHTLTVSADYSLSQELHSFA